MFVITGGGSGIGQALARMLATRGFDVLVVGRRYRLLTQLASESSHITALKADVACAKGRDALIHALRDVPFIQGLVHNAGVIEPILPLTALSESAWRQVMATNLDAPCFLTQRLHAKLQHGRVLMVGSGAAYFPVLGWSAYCVSKAALAMLTRCMQLECAGHMACASVMPGIVDTPMQAAIRGSSTMDSEKHEFFMQLYRDKKLVSATQVAAFLTWLLLDIDSIEFSAQEWDIYDPRHQAFLTHA